MVAKDTRLVAIRLRVDILGEFHGVTHPKRGDAVEVESYDAARYYEHGYVQPAEVKELGDPYKPYRGAA
jgi:hypothetical protein